MKKMNIKIAILFVNLFIATNILFAQNKVTPIEMPQKGGKNQQWEVGLSGGLMQYNGELNTFGLKENHIALGGTARYHFTNNFAGRINFIAGQLSGNDANNPDNAARNISFKAGARELAFLGELDLLGNRRYSGGGFRRMISPYLFGGIAAASIAPEVIYFKDNDKTKFDIDSKYAKKKISLAIPIGGGLKFDLSEKWTFNVEAGYRLLFSDYADGVSQLGNPDDNDSYAYAGATLAYRIPVVFDTDGDGVKDADDLCPNSKGSKRTKGCPDTDGDGVFDQEDKCPKEKGSATSKGCPDADGDGVGDKDDKCPNDKGVLATRGCPDTDSDGVADKDDKCPDTGGTAANKGCPDTDGDGVVDIDDPCPKERGAPEGNGCPETDTDSDGVADLQDKCPNVKGSVGNNGCPEVDTDYDGVADSQDKCPNIKGSVSNNGCPADTDGDGVVDSQDACPTAKGTTQTNGCPDRDGDGVEDGKDACPDVAGTTAKGCPPVTVQDQKVLESAIYGVQFESGTARLKQSSYDVLDNIADVMNRNGAYSLEIRGHTDNVGEEASNQELSENRARACYNYLLTRGISSSKMNSLGFGETLPIDDNATPNGRAKNRRVEFELK